jgi:thioester reductase-like protein
VILNAWPVDFKLAIDSFLVHLQAVRQFIDFASQSAHGTRLFFISSITAVGKLLDRHQILPEAVSTDLNWDSPDELGYGQSKFIAERLPHDAARESGIKTAICRVGQVAGPTIEVGMWPQKEWLPSLVESSRVMGKLPDSLGKMGVVDWITVDVLGKSMVELVSVFILLPNPHIQVI